ncbi:MAG: hypothetical protein KDA22_08175 [Phycisphaerales bacterium]|nr:hypothetical protein [Phycisphaerales bacterium]
MLPRSAVLLLGTFLVGTASSEVLVDQQPAAGGGVSRWSQLWQDPNGDNDLDSDSVCWQDFTLTAQTAITHIEWWGTGASELGFQIEIWPQDPGTLAYQPLAVFYYGEGNPPPVPEAMFATTAYATSPGPGGLTHFVLELASPIVLEANTSANPRWFIGVVGLTSVPYATWNWAQGLGGSNKSYQFIRGGPIFWSLPEGRALVLGDDAVSCAGDLNGDDAIDGADLGLLLGNWGNAGAGDLDGSGAVDGADLGLLLGLWGACP